MNSFNIAQLLRENSISFPDQPALVFPQQPSLFERLLNRLKRSHGQNSNINYSFTTFDEMESQSNAYAEKFVCLGIVRGTKVIIMVKSGPELFSIVFALFKVGAIPVIVDPGMGISRMLHCYRTVGAEAFIGIPMGHLIRILNPKVFGSLRKKAVIYVGRGFANSVKSEPGRRFSIAATGPDDLCIINFTTGSTGPAKGVEYSHGMVQSMVKLISEQFHQSAESVSLATLPLFAFFDLLIGSTSVLPPMDPTRPAQVNSDLILKIIERFQVTHMFASPAFLHRVGEFGKTYSIQIPSVRQIISGGAPVSLSVLECFRSLLSVHALIQTTYGSTEALPISSIEFRHLIGKVKELTETGSGNCVGLPSPGVEVRIIPVSEASIPSWSDVRCLNVGEVGEIVLSGQIVSRRYHGSSELNSQLKIPDGNDLWHRTGDLGWLDTEGKIWFCGRKAHRVITPQEIFYTVQWEGIFNSHPEVYRSALVGVGASNNQAPIVCIELRKNPGLTLRENANREARVRVELEKIAAARSLISVIPKFLFHPSFPVDIRHNAKIDRAMLSRWASFQLSSKFARFGLTRTQLGLTLIPVAGWVYIILGIVFHFESSTLRALWFLDLFLSVGVHGAQLAMALPIAKKVGFDRMKTVLFTFLFGATWWRALKTNWDNSI